MSIVRNHTEKCIDRTVAFNRFGGIETRHFRTWGTTLQSDHRANRLLSRLSRPDLALIEPHLEALDLPLRHVLEERKKPAKFAYFPVSGIASVVAENAAGASIEVGLIGFEGMSASSIVMGVERAPHAVYMQVAGAGYRLPAKKLLSALDASPSLRGEMLRFAHSFYVQATFTALSNGQNKIDERLARWLLMAQERLKSDEIPLTHEFIAIMLGVQRSGVTVVLNGLVQRGLIEQRRGVLHIVDRIGLEAAAHGAYVAEWACSAGAVRT